MLMSVSAFSVDIMLPSFPRIVTDLDAAYGSVQWTITLYMFMAGAAQIVWGPLSDRIGRKPVLAAGLVIYLAGAAMSAVAPSIFWLLAGRALQGFGGAATTVLARAVMRDLFSGQELARSLALVTAIFAVGPIAAPLVGAAIGVPFGWRVLFGALAVFAVGLISVLIWLPETIRAKAPDAIAPRVLASRAARLVRNPQSRYFLILSAISMASMLLIIIAAPRIFDVSFGITGTLFATMFALHGTGIVVGQALNRRMIPRLGIVRAMIVGNCILIVSASLITVTALLGWLTPWSLVVMFMLFSTSHLIVFSNASALVLDPHGDIAGFAAAGYGFVSQIGASLLSGVLILLAGGDPLIFGFTLLALCLVMLVMILNWHWRYPPRRGR